MEDRNNIVIKQKNHLPSAKLKSYWERMKKLPINSLLGNVPMVRITFGDITLIMNMMPYTIIQTDASQRYSSVMTELEHPQKQKKKGNDMIYNKNDDRMNSSGCKDMTAYRAMKNIKKEERRALIVKLKELANQHGYDIISIIRLKELECDDFGK